MNIIIPKSTEFFASTIPETDYNEYDAGTTYGEGDKVIVVSEHKIYESLSDGNTGNAPATYASWWLDSGATNRWKVYDSKTHSQSMALTSSAWAVEVSYADSIAVFNILANSIRVIGGNLSYDVISNAATWSGATATTPPNDWSAVGTPSDFSVTGSILKITTDAAGEGISQDIAVTPLEDMLFCTNYSNATLATCQFSVYDATNATSIISTTSLPSSISDFSLGFETFTVPASCATITISLTAKSGGNYVQFGNPSITPVLNDVTTSLLQSTVAGSSSIYIIVDWYTYFFEPTVQKTEYTNTSLYPVSSVLLITQVVGASLASVYCGEIIVGAKKYLGITRSKPSIGINDYSIKQQDSFGNYSITERAYSKKLSCDLVIDNVYLDEFVRTLATYRATPVVWVASQDYDTLVVYGFYKNFDVVFSYPGYSECNLEVEGLT